MFKRFGAVATIEVIDSPAFKKLKSNWQDVVRNSFYTKEIAASLSDIELNLQDFLLYRTRAISGFEKWQANRNGDGFNWNELKKSAHTFVGKGIFEEHQSDDWQKAKGIILLSSLNNPEQYVEIIGALDKNKFPELAARIRSGELNGTSMSCEVQKAVCGVCQNIAYDYTSLCEHMNPNSPHYVKGKVINGARVYELNFDVTFTEDSLVKLPADPEAKIIKVMGSAVEISAADEDKENAEKPEEKKPEVKKPEGDGISAEINLADMVDKAIARKVRDSIRSVVDREIEKALGVTIQEQTAQQVPAIKSVVEEKKTDVVSQDLVKGSSINQAALAAIRKLLVKSSNDKQALGFLLESEDWMPFTDKEKRKEFARALSENLLQIN